MYKTWLTLYQFIRLLHMILSTFWNLFNFSFQIYDMLKKLQNEKIKVTCLNYKCKKEFSDGIKFYHHASICKPLYQCNECCKEFSSDNEFIEHQCITKDKRKKVNILLFNFLQFQHIYGINMSLKTSTICDHQW